MRDKRAPKYSGKYAVIVFVTLGVLIGSIWAYRWYERRDAPKDPRSIISQTHAHRFVPQDELPEGSFSPAIWEWLSGGKYNFGSGDILVSTALVQDDYWLRFRHVPNENGTWRIVMVSDLPRSTRGYSVKQTIMFESPWDSGSPPESAGGKVGFGLAGGELAGAGNTVTAGWSTRVVWDRDRLVFYLYYANRPSLLAGKSPAYGHSIPSGVTYTPGQPNDVKMEVVLNTPGEADGEFRGYVDGKLVLTVPDVLWMEGEPEVDKCWLNTFHGGNNSDYSPARDVFSLVKDVQYEAMR